MGAWPASIITIEKSGIRIMERLYSLKTAAEMLDVSKRTLRRIIEDEDIKVYQVGQRLRLSESQVKSMIKPQMSAKAIVDEVLND